MLKDILSKILAKFNENYSKQEMSKVVADVFRNITSKNKFKYNATTYEEDGNKVIEIFDVKKTEDCYDYFKFIFYDDAISFCVWTIKDDFNEIWKDEENYNEMDVIYLYFLDNAEEIYDELWNKVKQWN